MIDTDVRTVRVGSTDVDVWARITNKTDTDITAIQPEIRAISPAGVVGDWATPQDTEHPSTSLIRVAYRVAEAVEVGWWELEAQVDGEIITLGGFRVVA